MKLSLYLILAVSVLLSCTDDDSPKQSTYVIVSTNGVPGKGTFSTYNTSTEEFKTIDFSTDNRIYITDINVSGDNLYFIIPTFGLLKKIDIKSGQEKKVKAHVYDYVPALIDFFGENVVISTRAQENTSPHNTLLLTKIYSKDLVLLDSITGIQAHEIYDTEIVGDNLYVSTRTLNGDWSIEVFNLTTRKFTASIPSPTLVQQLVYDNHTQLLCVSPEKLNTLELSSLKFKQSIHLLYGAVLVNNSAAYNNQDNLLYSFRNTYPAPSPFQLYSVDLNTGQATNLSEFGDLVLNPILFDHTTGAIVVGADHEFKIYSKQGKLLDRVPLPSSLYSYKMFIQ